MIIVLCGVSKRPYVFPDAVAVAPSHACPADDCTATGPGRCVLGVKDGAIACLATFTAAVVEFGCDCTEAPCEHMTEEHPAMGPLLDCWADHVEPAEVKIQRAKDDTRARLLGHIGTFMGTPDRGRRSMQQRPSTTMGRIRQHMPEADHHLPLRRKEERASEPG